jgi:hypothetical protein
MSTFAQELVPLAAFSAHRVAIKALVAEYTTKDTAAIAAACAAAFEFLAAAYDDKALPGSEDRAQVSFIKSTEEHGNTSVSQGVACKLALKRGQVGGMLNGGTGDVKFQFYLNTADAILRVLFERKAGGVSLQCVGKPLTAAERTTIQGQLRASLEACEGQLAATTSEMGLPASAANARPFRVFITGTVRNEWEAGGPRAAELEASANELLNFDEALIRPAGDSYFMPQSVEAALEFTATTSMHRNLTETKLIDPALSVLMSLGIGRGTGQAAVEGADGRIIAINFPHGMNDYEELKELPARFVAALKQCAAKRLAAPVIALKSGALLLPEANAEFKKKLMALLKQPTRSSD